ncbi:hypothetical protein DFJ73DRAFT_799662, partial [Zopfochytrium polystomum]
MTPPPAPHIAIFSVPPAQQESVPPPATLRSRREGEPALRKTPPTPPPSAQLSEYIGQQTVCLHILSRLRDLQQLVASVWPTMLIVEWNTSAATPIPSMVMTGKPKKATRAGAAETVVAKALSLVRKNSSERSKRCFVLLWNEAAATDIVERSLWMHRGASTCTTQMSVAVEILSTLLSIHTPHPTTTPPDSASRRHHQGSTKPLPCPFCGHTLYWRELYHHIGLLHAGEPDATAGGPASSCFLCRAPVRRLLRHLRDRHRPGCDGADGRRSRTAAPRASTGSIASLSSLSSSSSSLYGSCGSVCSEARAPVFVLVVVRGEDGRFLLVDETGDQGWWLPGGPVGATADLRLAAEQQTLLKTGVPVTVTGILRVEFTPSAAAPPRLRVVFLAKPTSPHPASPHPNKSQTTGRAARAGRPSRTSAWTG